jgi:hypothetical protein
MTTIEKMKNNNGGLKNETITARMVFWRRRGMNSTSSGTIGCIEKNNENNCSEKLCNNVIKGANT